MMCVDTLYRTILMFGNDNILTFYLAASDKPEVSIGLASSFLFTA